MTKNTTIQGATDVYRKADIKSGKAQRAKEGGESSKPVSKGEDKFVPSHMAKELEDIKKAFDALPDVRADKVEAIKQKISSGKYSIEASDLVEAMLELAVKRGREG